MGVGSLGFLAKPLFPFASEKGRMRASDVIQCFDENATSGYAVNESVVQIMMDESIKTLTGISDVGEAWKSIFPAITEDSIIGIKVNAAWSPVPTRPEFVNCIINGLTEMNFGGSFFKRNNVIIWDRTDSDLQNAGYIIYAGSDPDIVRCFGSNHSGVGYDTNTPLTVDYYPNGTVTKYPSRIMSILCDYLINVPVLKNHTGAQVTINLKNHYGSIDQPVGNPPHYNLCNPSIPSLNQQIRDVVKPPDIQKIFIVDALWASVVNGPMGNPDWNRKKLIMSLDTVACDYQGWNIINDERTGSGYSEIPWPVLHIESASQDPYNLGTTDVNLIEIINPSGIEEQQAIIPMNGFMRIEPNPFSTGTNIVFLLPHAAFVHLDIIDASGRIKAKPFSGQLSEGKHRVVFTPHNDFAAGTYFARLQGCGKIRIQKVTCLR